MNYTACLLHFKLTQQSDAEPELLPNGLTVCVCFYAGTFRGVCKDIDHFAEDGDYEQDAAEYLLRM